MKFAYADPPYIGQAKKHYSHDPNCAEVDHAALIDRLCCDFPDGWALSLSSPSLKQIIALCPDDVRVMAWVKPFCAFKANVNPAYAWEPVIVRGGRKRTREQVTTRDWLAESITLRKGLTGAKPKEFCYWIFDVLNVEPGDSVDDLFPGTGIVSRCLADYLDKEPLQRQPLFVFDERTSISIGDIKARGIALPVTGSKTEGEEN